MKKNAAEDRLRELEEAHLSQSELVARLRAENTTVDKYRKTVHEQESVIVKLEQLMESALSDKKRLQAALDDAAVHQRPGGPHDAGGRKVSAAAQAANDELRAEIADERTKRLGKKTIRRATSTLTIWSPWAASIPSRPLRFVCFAPLCQRRSGARQSSRHK
jgi:hypothetical protein